jgi:hypothetical protein
MKKIGLVTGILAVLVLLSGVALAECVRDCFLTYNTCLDLCSQTGKGNDSECIEHCKKGRNGCIKRCDAKEERSENTIDRNKDSYVVSDLVDVESKTTVTASSGKSVSTVPVSCSKANAVKPIVVAENDSPCPGKVYCNNPNANCGEYCCEWGYFYSTPCDCKCYRNSYDASAACSTYFRCN